MSKKITRKELRRFKKFLRDNQALGKFKKNLREGDAFQIYPSMNMLSKDECFLCSFVWEKTPEGFEYWRRLDSLYYNR